ncbi:hypothetical protein A2U01_0070114, partial [Trifolium medium]|nr:hypothetical protein [Trifolium medium]
IESLRPRSLLEQVLQAGIRQPNLQTYLILWILVKK